MEFWNRIEPTPINVEKQNNIKRTPWVSEAILELSDEKDTTWEY